MRISIDKAAEMLSLGAVVSVPTETVYGLAASLHCPEAIARIFALKGRPLNNPLIVHLKDASSLGQYVDITEDIRLLSENFWPGPMTLVLPVTSMGVPSIVSAGLPTAAFRVPAHPKCQMLLEKTGPLVMPSANLSGKPSSTLPSHVENDFGDDFPVIDGSVCQEGIESTILVKTEKWAIARLGALSPEMFLPVLGYLPALIEPNNANRPLCPGQMYRHYAPKAKLHCLEDTSPPTVGAIIGFEDRHYFAGSDHRFFSLGLSTNPATALQRLYSILRELDEQHITSAWVDMSFPKNGLWLTLRERLLRASC